VLTSTEDYAASVVGTCPTEFSSIARGPDGYLYGIDIRLGYPHRLWKIQTNQPVGFDRKTNIGLHHLALRVTSEQELNETYQKIAKSKYKIEFAPELLRQGPSKHFMVYGPSQIRIEFIHYV
jgi:hypothetical protein